MSCAAFQKAGNQKLEIQIKISTFQKKLETKSVNFSKTKN